MPTPRVEFEGFSGSSAGAMNAVVLASRWVEGGRDGARHALDDFWKAVGKQMLMGMATQGEGDGGCCAMSVSAQTVGPHVA